MDYSGDEFGLGIRTVQWSPNSKILALGNYDDSVSNELELWTRPY